MMSVIALRRRGHSCRRRGFTLVEMLVVISIIAILASMILVALWGVAENARQHRTMSTIKRVDTYIRAHWDGFADRRVGIRVGTLPGLPTAQQYQVGLANSGIAIAPANQRYIAYGRFIAYLRLAAIREIMRMELPDRKADLLTPQELGASPPPILIVGANDPRTNLTTPLLRNVFPAQLDSVPSLWRAYRSKAASMLGTQVSAGPGWHSGWTPENESSECLYLILSMMQDDDRSALDWFNDSEIGDTDRDGMPEILDSWGNPIVFIRWPAGFVKQYVYQGNSRDFLYQIPYSSLMAGDKAWQEDGSTVEAHVHAQTVTSALLRDWQSTGGSDDPFDPLKSDIRWYDAPGARFGTEVPYDPSAAPHNAWNNDPFELIPLIVSAGPDKRLDMVQTRDLVDGSGNPVYWWATTTPSVGGLSDNTVVPNDPYAGKYVTDSGVSRFVQAGSVYSQPTTLGNHSAGDNIHNHAVEIESP